MEAGAAHLRAAGAQLGSGHLADTARQRWQAATAAAADSWQHLRETAAHFNPRELAEKFKLIVLTDGERRWGVRLVKDGVRSRSEV